MRRAAVEIIWRLGNEILLNHPKSKPDDVSLFNNTMKNIGVENYLPISLEQVYYLLCDGQTEEAYRVLSVAESWRFGKISISQDRLRKLLQAYKAVLDYRSWMDKRSTANHAEMDYSSQSRTSQHMNGLFRQAAIGFQAILQYPGVWDPFVLCYVDLLEFSGDQSGAEKVLTDYAYNSKNPTNPNAHVYLYQFLKRNGASKETLIKVLKILYSLVPSHQLMLQLSKLLRKSKSEEDQQLSLRVLFDLLDFCGWKDSEEAWSALAKRMKRIKKCGQSSWISEIWTSRSDWWPSYHFRKGQGEKDWGRCERLALRKAFVAGLLQGPACSYFSEVYPLSDQNQAYLDGLKKITEIPDN
ncbi:TATA box-binding protein-associated factor RNA polymerase I subunit A [Gastrophryne carolinensis]